MPDFWQAIPSIRAQYGQNFHAFKLFDPTHIIELSVCACACAAVIWFYRRSGTLRKQQVLRALAVLMVADEIAKYIATAATGQWSWIYLPLHLCSINIFVCFYHAVSGSERAGEILYALCLPGALAALLSPSWQAAPVWNFMHLHSASIHFMLALYPLLLLADGFRPNARRWPWVCGFFVCAAVPIYFINKALGTNFFFLNGTGGNTVLEAMASVFGARFYLAGYMLFICATQILLYLPWAAKRRCQNSLPVSLR